MNLRALITQQLWTRQLFVGITVIDELLFEAVRAREADPVLTVLETLVDGHVLNPGYVIYPLHSFGLRHGGLLLDKSSISSEGLARKYGVAISPQQNTMATVCAWLTQVHEWFGVTGTVPADLLEHWERSRSRWLKRNPLLALKITAVSGSYYENQRFLLDRLDIATTFLGGLSVRQDGVNDRDSLFTTRRLNNWSTLDIHHYFVMSAIRDEGGSLTGNAVPHAR
jgi:hypothetical protein